jgi:hypothetical protein
MLRKRFTHFVKSWGEGDCLRLYSKLIAILRLRAIMPTAVSPKLETHEYKQFPQLFCSLV